MANTYNIIGTVLEEIAGVRTVVNVTGGLVTTIHDTDLPAVKTDTGNIRTVDVVTITGLLAAIASEIDAISLGALPAILTDINTNYNILFDLEAERLQRTEPNVATNSSVDTVYVDIININDKGFFTSFKTALAGDNARYMSLKVIIDGVTIFDDRFLSLSDVADFVSATIVFNAIFNTSLQVQHKVDNIAVLMDSMVTYSTD